MTSTRELIERQHLYKRPKIKNLHEIQPPDIIEKRRYQNKLWESVKLTSEQAPAFPCNRDFLKRISGPLYDLGKENYFYNEDFAELRLLKSIDNDLANRFLSPLKDEEKRLFSNYLHELNQIVQGVYEGSIADTKEKIQSGVDHQKIIDGDIEKVKKFRVQEIAELKSINAEKSKPARIYSEEQKASGIHMQEYSLDDLQRSKDNLLNKKLDLKKRIKNLEKQIDELNSQIQPLQEKITKSESQLSGDNLTEKDFKDIKISIEYNQNKIKKLADKILPLSVENSEHYLEIEKIDYQLQLLDVLIKKEKLIKDIKVNEPRRRERLLFRVEKFMRKHGDMETSRLNLNNDWKKLTGDIQDIIGPLGLKADAQMYFI